MGIVVLPALVGTYTVTLLNYVGMSALAALGLVLLTGVGGLTSFGQAAFVGIGAYATAWADHRRPGCSPWLGLLLGLALAGARRAVAGRRDAALCPDICCRCPPSPGGWRFFFLFGNLDALGRHNGIVRHSAGDARAAARCRSATASGYLVWAVTGAALLLVRQPAADRARAAPSARSAAARLWPRAWASTPSGCGSRCSSLSALCAALSGWLFAHVQRVISPAAFDIGHGIEYLFMAMLGGAGHIGGAVLGAALVTLARDGLQDVLALFGPDAGQAEAVVFSVLFIVVLQTARGGIIPALERLRPGRAPPLPQPAPPLPRRTKPAAGTVLLEAEGLVKRFGGLLAVNEVSFSVRAGEILGLIGPNGAGKSTLLDLVSGSLRPDGGRVRLLGSDVTGCPARRIAALGLARTFQHVRLRPAMSVLENVMLGAHLRGRAGLLRGALALDRAEERRIGAEAMRALRRVGLDEAASGPAGNLPLGRQRVLEVARALAADPVLIVLDEPAAGLRRMEKQALAGLLRGLRDEGMTIVLVEHDMAFVMGLVDRIVVLEFGVRLAEGPPEAIRADARVQAAYLGGVA